MKKYFKNNNDESILELVCADIRNHKIYTTSGTMKRSLVFGSDAADLINKFRALYPTFKVEVNDIFFLKKLSFIPE